IKPDQDLLKPSFTLLSFAWYMSTEKYSVHLIDWNRDFSRILLTSIKSKVSRKAVNLVPGLFSGLIRKLVNCEFDMLVIHRSQIMFHHSNTTCRRCVNHFFSFLSFYFFY